MHLVQLQRRYCLNVNDGEVHGTTAFHSITKIVIDKTLKQQV